MRIAKSRNNSKIYLQHVTHIHAEGRRGVWVDRDPHPGLQRNLEAAVAVGSEDGQDLRVSMRPKANVADVSGRVVIQPEKRIIVEILDQPAEYVIGPGPAH